MNIDTFTKINLKKKGVTINYPGSGEFAWLKVMGKMYGMYNVKATKVNGQTLEPFAMISLKCEPDKSIELRASLGSIQEGWHLNKKHWITLYLDHSINDELILQLTENAYQLVGQGLTRKDKLALKSL